jgi:hypothetical protein
MLNTDFASVFCEATDLLSFTFFEYSSDGLAGGEVMRLHCSLFGFYEHYFGGVMAFTGNG